MFQCQFLKARPICNRGLRGILGSRLWIEIVQAHERVAEGRFDRRPFSGYLLARIAIEDLPRKRNRLAKIVRIRCHLAELIEALSYLALGFCPVERTLRLGIDLQRFPIRRYSVLDVLGAFVPKGKNSKRVAELDLCLAPEIWKLPRIDSLQCDPVVLDSFS